ncbi:MAG: glycosyltransferase family 4 protein, partial [Bacteroidales bacterium]
KYSATNFIWIRYTLINKVINLITRTYTKVTGVFIPHFGILQTIRKLGRKHYDYIVVEGSIQMLSAIAERFDNARVYFHLHSATLFSNPDVYKSCSKVIVVSEFLKGQVLSNTKLTEDRIEVLKNCVNLDKFRKIGRKSARSKIRERYRIKDNELVISYVGRIDEGKGVRELIRSLALTRKELKYTVMVIGSAGLNFGRSGNDTEYYKEIMTLALSLKQNVIFTGFIHNDLLPEMLAATDILVVPSIGEEAQGLVVLEGFAAGLPVITTDSGGIPENISTDCAIMVRRDNDFVTNLSMAIQDLVLSGEKRLRMGTAGLSHVSNYSCVNYYRNFITILNG